MGLNVIKVRWAKATPGPWKKKKEDGSRFVVDSEGCSVLQPLSKANAEAIAHAPEDIAALLTRVEAALEVIHRFGGIDGQNHKTWVIDQVVRALTGYGWSEGVPP